MSIEEENDLIHVGDQIMQIGQSLARPNSQKLGLFKYGTVL